MCEGGGGKIERKRIKMRTQKVQNITVQTLIKQKKKQLLMSLYFNHGGKIKKFE